jgi:RNA polymerase primary sigma factor/RNA polymerase nonessential primary-like sigma factor
MSAVRAGHAEPYSEGDGIDLLGRYLIEIGGTPLLTAQQEVELAKRIEAGVYARYLLDGNDGLSSDRPAGLSADRLADLRMVAGDGALAWDHMIRANLRLVVAVARKYRVRDMSLLDVIQEGNLGLIRAVEKFDYTRGYKFSTYAMWWIRQAIDRAVAQNGRSVRLPVHVVEELARYARIERELSRSLGRDVTVEELAVEARQPLERVVELKRLTQLTVSLDTPVGPNGVSLGALICDGEALGTEGAVEFAMVADQLRSLVAALPKREGMIITWRFGLDTGYPCSLQQIGDRLGLTRERVRQLESKALRRLREPQRLDSLTATRPLVP